MRGLVGKAENTRGISLNLASSLADHKKGVRASTKGIMYFSIVWYSIVWFSFSLVGLSACLYKGDHVLVPGLAQHARRLEEEEGDEEKEGLLEGRVLKMQLVTE
jgi:hypothetical protein